MTVMRVNKTSNYTVMSNYHLKEKEMSLKAKGLLSMMLSLPDNWDYSISGLVALCKENESAIKSALNELKKFGYLKVTKLNPSQTETGRYEYIYDVFEQPAQKQVVEKQGVENLPVEFLGVENHTLYKDTNKSNTNKSNTNELNTKDIYIPFEEIVEYLNLKANTKYKYKSNATQKLIRARFNEGYTLEDFKKVIENKVSEWKGTNFEQYLRPATLFGNKFESYLNQKPKAMTNAQMMDAIIKGEVMLNEPTGNDDCDKSNLLGLPF